MKLDFAIAELLKKLLTFWIFLIPLEYWLANHSACTLSEPQDLVLVEVGGSTGPLRDLVFRLAHVQNLDFVGPPLDEFDCPLKFNVHSITETLDIYYSNLVLVLQVLQVAASTNYPLKKGCWHQVLTVSHRCLVLEPQIQKSLLLKKRKVERRLDSANRTLYGLN